MAGQQFGFSFDDIGNRLTAAAGGDEWGANLRSCTGFDNMQFNHKSFTSYVLLGLCLALVALGVMAYRNPIQEWRPISELRFRWQMWKVNKMLRELKKDHISYTTLIELQPGKVVRIMPTSSVWIELINIRTNLQQAEFMIRVEEETKSNFFGVVTVSSNISFCPLIGPQALRLTSLTLSNAIVSVYGVSRE